MMIKFAKVSIGGQKIDRVSETLLPVEHHIVTWNGLSK